MNRIYTLRGKAVLLMALAVVAIGLVGCSKKDEPTDPNYYAGKDFKGHGGPSAKTGGDK